MRQSRPLFLILSAAVLILAVTFLTLPNPSNVLAQGEVPAADTPTGQPTEPPTDEPTATATETAEAPTATATAEAPATATATTEAPATATVDPGETVVPPAPVTIPEPITVVLFGTGLAALSAAAASRRKNESGKNDE